MHSDGEQIVVLSNKELCEAIHLTYRGQGGLSLTPRNVRTENNRQVFACHLILRLSLRDL